MDDIYGPEDIEQLMLSKDFSELYPEEREYVLRHIDGESEYSAMRKMLLDVSTSEDPITPPMNMREEMIALHESSHKRTSFKVWLNSLFAAVVPKVEWRRPALQLAGLAGVILAIGLIYRTMAPDLGQSELALEPQKSEKESPTPLAKESDVPIMQEEQISSADDYEPEENGIKEPILDRKDDSSADLAITNDYSLDLEKAESDLALDAPPQQGVQEEIIENDLEENTQIAEVIFEDDEVELMEEITEADEDVLLDGYTVESAKDIVDLNQSEVLATAPAATSSVATEAIIIPLSDAAVPTELLSLFLTAW